MRRFTLIELLVVIAIVFLLAGIVITSFFGTEEKPCSKYENVTYKDIPARCVKYFQ